MAAKNYERMQNELQNFHEERLVEYGKCKSARATTFLSNRHCLL